MLCKILGREDILLFRLVATLTFAAVTESINDQITLDGDRLVLVVVEVNAASETSGRGAPRLKVDRVFPKRGKFGCHPGLSVFRSNPRNGFGQLQ